MEKTGSGKRILIASTAVGGGHKVAATALVEALAERAPDAAVLNIDILDLGPRWSAQLYAKSYTLMAGRFPSFYAYQFARTDRPPGPDMTQNKGLASATVLDRWVHRRFVQAVREFNPDQIICTHFLPVDVLGKEKRAGRLKAPIGVVVTDYYMHGYWCSPHGDHYFTPTDEIRNELEQIGLAPERITVTGIPIRPRFSHDYNDSERAAIVDGLKIDPSRPTITLCAGGWRTGGMEEMIDAALHTGRPINLIALVGANTELQAKMTDRAWPDGVNGTVIGFTDRMHEIMQVSDVVITKPGGLTTAECLALGVAMIVVSPVPGQETYNCDWLLEQGAALKAQNPLALAYKLKELLHDDARLASLKASAAKLGRPNAAYQIAEAVCPQPGG